MRCAVYKSQGKVEREVFDTPVPAADEVLIRIVACGVCGSDIHRIYHATAEEGVVLGHE